MIEGQERHELKMLNDQYIASQLFISPTFMVEMDEQSSSKSQAAVQKFFQEEQEKIRKVHLDDTSDEKTTEQLQAEAFKKFFVERRNK